MGADLLILTVYFICVTYVLYQMALSLEERLEDQVQIVLETDALKEAVVAQLRRQRRDDIEVQITSGTLASLVLQVPVGEEETATITISVSPQGKRPLQPAISALQVSVINTLPDQQVLLNWDNSALSLQGGPAYRVVRQVPGMPVDLLQPQVFTLVHPGQAAEVPVTSEARFQRPEGALALETQPVLIDLKSVTALPPAARIYSLQILTWIRSMTHPEDQGIQLLLPFNFHIEVLPEHVALPVLGWLLNFFSPKARSSSRA